MKERNKTAIIVAVIGGFATVGGSICGMVLGNNYGKNHQEQYIESQISNVNGDNNTVTINSVSDLVAEYNKLLSDNETLKTQNVDYFNDLSDASSKLKELEDQMGNIPSISYNNVALSINGEDVSINKNNSLVTIDGRDYVSEEIMEKLIPDNQSVTIKDDTIYVGQVIADKTSLLNQDIIMDQNNIFLIDSITDSYGKNYSNVFYTRTSCTGEKSMVLVLNRKYSLLKFTVAIRDNADIYSTGIITIKADDEVVYTSESLNKKMEPLTEFDIPINNCNLLTIEYAPSSFCIDCIIADIYAYN
ncbi:MAG: hypothetical protein J6K53_11800 [Roseburia sp.]|nr:hypothetical protein [Roseburia sp.]